MSWRSRAVEGERAKRPPLASLMLVAIITAIVVAAYVSWRIGQGSVAPSNVNAPAENQARSESRTSDLEGIPSDESGAGAEDVIGLEGLEEQGVAGGANEGGDADEVVNGADPPIEVPNAVEESWREGGAGRSWTYSTDANATEVARSVLHELESGSWSLENAGYLGLGDDSWGCVATAPDKSSVVMVLGIPDTLGIEVSNDNPLVVTVVELNVG